MANRASQSSELKILPVTNNESLYVGIDVAKAKHVAGFLSKTLLQRHERFEACPVLIFENSREGFRSLVERIGTYAPLEQCFVLMELTGHYHRALQQYLQELDVPVYIMHVQTRPAIMLKTDKRDALMLANHLYNQLELGVQVANKMQLVRQVEAPSPAAAQLKSLIRHRYELIHESTRRKNKLTALCDELFPELVYVFKDPNSPTALLIREQFPSPYSLATASLVTLKELRGGARSISEAKLQELQQLAAQSIGTKDVARQRGLILEQSQLIKELRLLREHLSELESEITSVVEQAREGQILRSLPGVGPIMAASIIAAIGSINNFSSAAKLKAYFGWAPVREQTGVSYDRTHLTRGGTRLMKQMMFMIVFQAIHQQDNEWAKLYERLVKAKCPFDERKQVRTGKLRVIGRVAGQMIETMYALLKRDAEVVNRVPVGQELPKPMLYDPEVHRSHREGHYKPLKSVALPNVVTLLPAKVHE
jgi:transposase